MHGFLWGMLGLFVLWRVVRGVLSRAEPSNPGRRVLREAGAAVGFLVALAAFLLIGAVWHRPMAALAGIADDEIVADFHSHTNASHDVHGTLMNGFDAAASRRWHARAGFDAFFITDHNTVQGLRDATFAPDGPGPIVCPGIEVSAWRSHIVLLGDTSDVDRRLYNGSLDKVLDLLHESVRRYGALTVASIPEYDDNLWTVRDSLVAAGVDGFEIVNAAPKASEFTTAHRDTIIALARRSHLALLGVSDSHGWGATSMTWNVLPLPDWRSERARVCARVLDRLRTAGPDAVQIVERHRLRPDAWWPRWLTAVGVVWETWRGLGWAQVAGWLGWIWGVSAIVALRGRRGG
jgi:hypothetical protein